MSIISPARCVVNYRAFTMGNVNHCHRGDIRALLICNSQPVCACVCRRDMGRRACFRPHPPCLTGLPVLVVRARYPYSSSSLGAALHRPPVIGPAHIVSVSSHATTMQRCKQHANTRLQDVSSRQRLAPTGRLRRRTPSTSSRTPRCHLVDRCTAGDHSARARRRVTQGLLFFA